MKACCRINRMLAHDHKLEGFHCFESMPQRVDFRHYNETSPDQRVQRLPRG